MDERPGPETPESGQKRAGKLIRMADVADARAGHGRPRPAMDGFPHARLAHLRRATAAVLAIAALVLVRAATAPAAHEATQAPQARWPVGGAALATAAELAAAHWGATPCDGRVSISWVTLAPGVNSSADWAYAGADPYGAPRENTDCAIRLSTAADWDWPKLCTVVVHEIGHLTGHDHAEDVHDVMAAQYLDPVEDCATIAEPAADAAILSTYLSAPVVPAAAPAAPAAARPKAKAKRPARRKVRARAKARTAPGRHAAQRRA